MPRSRTFDRAKYARASRRALRRAQLWHASRLAVADYEAWRAAWPDIGAGIESILEREFGA